MTEQTGNATITTTHSYPLSFFFQDLMVLKKNDDSEKTNMTTSDNCKFLVREVKRWETLTSGGGYNGRDYEDMKASSLWFFFVIIEIFFKFNPRLHLRAKIFNFIFCINFIYNARKFNFNFIKIHTVRILNYPFYFFPTKEKLFEI